MSDSIYLPVKKQDGNIHMEENASPAMNPAVLKNLVTEKMPFGKYKGMVLCDLPEEYVVWLYGKGLPSGRLGMLLGTLYEIKVYGLEHLLDNIKA